MGRFSLRRLTTFESFKVPVFRIYFASLAGQWAGMSMQQMTRSLLVYRITGSGAFIGIMALGLAIPALLVSLLGGAIADRVQKKYILILCQMTTCVISLIVALALIAGYLSEDNPGSWWVLLITAIGQGTVMGFMMPARMAMIPEIVGEERVMNAISLTMMGQTVFRLIGPALAGFLIDAYDFAAVYFVMAGMYLIATICAFFLPRTVKTTSGEKRNTLHDIAAGFRYIRSVDIFLLIFIFGVAHRISGMPYQQLLPIFTEDILGVGASGLGLLMTVSGAGALVGSLVLASLPNKKRGMLLIFSGIVMSVPLIVFSFSSWWWLSLLMMPLVGLGPAMYGTLSNTLVQYYADPNYRGRVQSFMQMGGGLASLGIFIAGVLSDSIGVQWAVGGMAMFLTAITIGFFIFSRRLMRLE